MRQPIQTELKCPVCGHRLRLDIVGTFSIDDHDYGFYQDGIANGYSCEADDEHYIYIKTGEIE